MRSGEPQVRARATTSANAGGGCRSLTSLLHLLLRLRLRLRLRLCLCLCLRLCLRLRLRRLLRLQLQLVRVRLLLSERREALHRGGALIVEIDRPQGQSLKTSTGPSSTLNSNFGDKALGVSPPSSHAVALPDLRA